jgi:hypothetical protein
VAELAFWLAAMAALLLAWPVTWAMNVVWLLPAALVVVSAWPGADGGARAALAACAAGLLLAAVPDGPAHAVLGAAASLKYVAAEAIVMVSLLAAAPRLARNYNRRDAFSERSVSSAAEPGFTSGEALETPDAE